MKYFVLPPLGLYLLAAFGWLVSLRWRRIGFGLVGLAIIALVMLSLPLVASWLMYPLQIYPPLNPARIPANVQAIVILSGDMQADAPEYGVDIVGPLTLERVRYGAYLYKRTRLPILVSGGHIQPRTRSLSSQMRETLTGEFDVPVRWVEDRSSDTHENALFSSEILRKDRIKSVLLVTHAWHMRRAMAAFRGTGLDPIPAPTRFIRPSTSIIEDLLPDASALRTSYYALHEWLGLLWYYVSGYTHTFS